MDVIQTKNFIVEAPENPLVHREDGGHIVINPKQSFVDRQQLSPALAIELMRLTIVTGMAMTSVLRKCGIDIGRVNYQDNGNWSVFKPEGPQLHIHLYGRAKNAIYQRYGQACFFPHRDENPDYYKAFKPLTKEDAEAIKHQIIGLLAEDKYTDSTWGL